MTKYSTTLARMGGVLLLAGAAVVGSTSQAEAAFVAAICDDAACTGGGDVIIEDESAFETGGGTGIAGVLVVDGANVADWEVALSISQTKPALGNAAQPVINLAYSLNNLLGANPNPNSIWLYAGDTDFTGTGSVQLAVNSSTTGQNTVGMALGGDNNTVGANGLNLAPLLASASFPGVFSTVISGPFVPTGGVTPYALTAGVMVTDTGGLTGTSGDVTVSVPEPATMALFGLGLFGAAVAARRRKQAQTIA